MSAQPRGNRPGLAELRSRVGTHGTFMAAMLQRIGTGRAAWHGGAGHGGASDPAEALCDAWAAIADVLTFYQERIANEGYLRTAVERRSIAELARLVGYRIRPGVAASVHVAFTTDADATAMLQVGTRLQTVPDDDEPARRFELIEPLEARAAWNAMRVRATSAPCADAWLAQFHVKGVAAPARPGDAIVVVAGGQAVPRRVAAVISDFERDRTLLRLLPIAAAAAATEAPPRGPADLKLATLNLANLADAIQGGLQSRVARPPHAASRLPQDLARLLAPESDVAMRLRGLSIRDGDSDNLFAALGALRGRTGSALAAHAMRLRTAPAGATAPPRLIGGKPAEEDWALSELPDVLFVEAITGEILPGTWVAFEAPPGRAVSPPRQVVAASVVGRVAYGVATRCTRLDLDGPWIDPEAASIDDLRALTVHIGSVPLVIADDDIEEPLGDTLEIELDRIVGELAPGRWLIVEGELADHPGARMSEVVMLAASRHQLPQHGSGYARTCLLLANRLSYRYRRSSVLIWGNVARATEGESVSEVLGSGDGSRSGQAFALSRTPLTYVSAATERGVASTLRVVVNGVEWQETDNLALAGPNDRVFVVEAEGIAATQLRFGNGINGARLPTGVENVTAQYRTGLGDGGNCDAGQISQLLTRPAGVRGVTNPRPASGGADAESRDAARRNAPIGVMALDRLVGVRDFSDFARRFAGVGKADATLISRRGGPTVLVTVAGHDETPIQTDAELLRSLTEALERWGDPSQPVVVLPARHMRVLLSARVGLAAGYAWDWVVPRLRRTLLDRFGYACRSLGQTLWQSELLAAMHASEGVANVDLDILAALSDPVTSGELQDVAAWQGVADIHARPGRLATTPQGRQPRPAEIAFLSEDMPELIALSELGG